MDNININLDIGYSNEKNKNIDPLEKYIKSINTHDFEEVKKSLSDEVEFIFTDKTCSDIKDIRKYFEVSWDELKDEKYEANQVKIVFENFNTKIYSYIFVYSGKNELGECVEGFGKAVNVFSLIDGNWKLVHEHLSN